MGKKINVKILLPLLTFLTVSLVFYYPVFLGKIPFNGNLLVSFFNPWKMVLPFKFMGIDEAREFYPLLDYTYTSLRSGTIPLWNPYNFSGYSHLGNWASAVFYPFHLIFFLASKEWSLVILKVGSPVLAGFFTYLYLRSIELSKKSSFFGGAAFAFSATMQIWTAEIWQSTHAFLWLPLVLFSIENIIKKNKLKFVPLLALSLGFSIMGGYIQPTIYLLILSAVYFLFRLISIKANGLNVILKTFMGYLLGFGISSIQLFPAIEAYILSPRSQVSLHDLNISFLIPINHIVTLFVPDFFGNIVTQNWFTSRPGQYYENMIYIGVIPLALTALSFFYKQYRGYIVFFTLVSLISLSLTLDLPTSRAIYDYSVPFLSSAIPIRVIFVFAFSISILSAIGFDWWDKNINKIKIILAIFPLVLIYFIIGGFTFFAISENLKLQGFPGNWYYISARNFVIPTAFLFASLFTLLLSQFIPKFKKQAAFLLIFLTILSSFMFAHKYMSFSTRKVLYPPHPLITFIKENQGHFRYWGYGSAAIPNNLATIYKINTVEGYDPVNDISYNELLSSTRNKYYEGTFSRSDALLFPVTEFPFKDINDVRYRMMDLLGIKYIGFEKGELEKIDLKRLDKARYKEIWQSDRFVIFENLNVFPRVFLANNIIIKDDKKSAISAIYDRNINLRTDVIVGEKIKQVKTGKEVRGSAKIITYTPNKVVVSVSAQKEAILVLSDTFYPGWKAKVNGKEIKILRADYALRAIFIPGGESRIEFSYDPLSFKGGFIFSFVSFFILGAMTFRNRKKI